MSIKLVNNPVLFSFLKISMVFFLISCGNKKKYSDFTSSNIEIIELDEFQNIISYNEQKLSNPQIIKYSKSNSHLFIYDAAEKRVLEFDGNSEIVNKYGRLGRGPGEFLRVNNIFLINNYLYVVDQTQFRISRFTFDGNFDGAFNYGKEDPQALPPSSPMPLEPRAKNLNNQPYITESGNILLSNIYPGDSFNTLFSLVDWEGDQISNVGTIPEGSAFILDYQAYRNSIKNREVPAYYRPNVFPVNNKGSKKEMFLIYSALPKIAKYNISGEKIWDTYIAEPTELDSLTTNFYEFSEEIPNDYMEGKIALDKYVAGISGPNGHLYLAVGKIYFANPYNRLWIHEFEANGNLVRRYKLESKDVNIPSIFDIDFEGRRIFVTTEEAEIRAYSF